jgi:hypothetical protein
MLTAESTQASVVAVAPCHGVLIPRCMGSVEGSLPISPPRSCTSLLCCSPACPIHRRAANLTARREHRSYSITSCHPPQEKSLSSLSTPSPAPTTSCPIPHRCFPLAESCHRRLPCTVSPVVPFRLKRVPYPSLVPSCTTLSCLVAGDGQNRPTNHRRGKGEGVPCF